MHRRLTGFALGVILMAAAHSADAQQCCPGEQCPGDLNCNNEVEINELITAVNAALAGCPALPTPTPGSEQRFPATGQTSCWDSAGEVIACDGSGQDGEFEAGGALAYVDNGDGTITDLNTRLMWEKLSRDGGIHDYSNAYTWEEAFVRIAALNSGGGFAGHTDWRLPNIKELQSLINYQNNAPAVSAAFNADCLPDCTATTCSCTQADFYWSSTTVSTNPSSAWYVVFNLGNVSISNKVSSHHVRAVRGGV